MSLYKWDRGDLEFKPLRIKTIFVAVMICIISLSIGGGIGAILAYSNIQTITLEREQLVILLSEADKKQFKPEQVYKYLVSINAPFPHILYAQALLESGGFKSNLFRTNNNCYGMRQPGKRATTSIGEQYRYASYNSWKECVMDRVLYNCLYLSDIKTESQYYEYLSKAGYAEDPNYILKLKSLADKVKAENVK